MGNKHNKFHHDQMNGSSFKIGEPIDRMNRMH